MDQILDKHGQPIEPGGSVRVGARSVPGIRAMVPGFSGRVEEVTEHCVSIREFDSWAHRNARPEDCRVLKRETKAGREYRAVEEGAKGFLEERRRRVKKHRAK